MNSIPANQLVSVVPSVLGAGGNPLSLNSVFLTQDTSIPLGTVKAFATLADVQDWFGSSAQESLLAAVYFGGWSDSTTLPGQLYFAQYNEAAVAGYMRGGSLAGMTLAQLQGLSGQLTLLVDGVSTTSLAINLASATSFSNAAALIQTGVQGGTPNTTATVTYDSLRQAFVVTSPTTGAASAITVATGTLSAGLKFTTATGAVTSAGAVAGTPAGILGDVLDVTNNWALFMTTWEPDTDGKLAFADWVQTQNERFGYVAWDSDATPQAGTAPSSFGAQVAAAEMDGIFVVWDADGKKAAFVCGITASIDFEQAEGRITYAFKSQAGLTADITNATVANNLLANGYNFYGSYATANDQFTILQNGAVAGAWRWFDAYVNQIWLNNALQLAYMDFLTNAKSVPYNAAGYAQLGNVAQDPIDAALLFGAIRPGVPLSQSQRAQVNTAAGANIADTLETQGYYLQILPASALTRANRESPPMTLWYMDGGSIQKIDLASINVQ